MNALLRKPERSEFADRFIWHADPPVSFRDIDENELERIKNSLLKAALQTVASPSLIPLIRRAANEAAAVAWLEPHPRLVFPALFEEKAAAARKFHHKQNMVRSRSELLMEVAA